MIEVETATSSEAAIVRAEALKRRFGTPGERALLVGEVSQLRDDTGNSKWRMCIVGFHRLTAFEFAARGRDGQERGVRMMRIEGGLTCSNRWDGELL